MKTQETLKALEYFQDSWDEQKSKIWEVRRVVHILSQKLESLSINIYIE